MVRILPLLILTLGAAAPATAAPDGRLRVRAREHFETIAIETADGGGTYEGFTNTIDVWWEAPFRYSIGLAGSPLLAKLYRQHEDVRLVHLGVEGKVFPLSAPLFARGGVYQATLKADEQRFTGESALFGIGWEFDLGGIGLAPEMAWRKGKLSDGVTFSGTAPAIGLHFYEAL